MDSFIFFKKQIKKKNPLNIIPLENVLLIPVLQYIDCNDIIIVKIGDYVFKGQPLTIANSKNFTVVHASTSGFVVDIESYVISYSSNLKEIYIHIKPDFKDKLYKFKSLLHYSNYSPKFLVSYIRKFGVVFFDSFEYKFIDDKNHISNIDTFVINGVKNCSYMMENCSLLFKYIDEIIYGIMIIAYILKPKKIWFIIDNSKIIAISMLRKIILSKNINMELKIISKIYVKINFEELIKFLINKNISKNISLIEMGVYTTDIATILAIKKAVVDSEPLIERIVTISSFEIKNPVNCLVRIGTTVNFLFKSINLLISDTKLVIMNNLSDNIKLINFFIPVNKITNDFIILDKKNDFIKKYQQPCIRCGFCSLVCPVNLLPNQIYLFSKNKNHNKTQEYKILNCTECGFCSYVCPSNIPLIEYFREEKIIIKTLIQRKQFSINAKKCYEFKINRINSKRMLRQKKYEKFLCKIKNENHENNIVIKQKINLNEIKFSSKSNDKKYCIDKYKMAVDSAVERVIEKRKLRDQMKSL